MARSPIPSLSLPDDGNCNPTSVRRIYFKNAGSLDCRVNTDKSVHERFLRQRNGETGSGGGVGASPEMTAARFLVVIASGVFFDTVLCGMPWGAEPVEARRN